MLHVQLLLLSDNVGQSQLLVVIMGQDDGCSRRIEVTIGWYIDYRVVSGLGGSLLDTFARRFSLGRHVSALRNSDGLGISVLCMMFFGMNLLVLLEILRTLEGLAADLEKFSASVSFLSQFLVFELKCAKICQDSAFSSRRKKSRKGKERKGKGRNLRRTDEASGVYGLHQSTISHAKLDSERGSHLADEKLTGNSSAISSSYVETNLLMWSGCIRISQ